MSEQLFDQAAKEGKQVVLYFRADWCSTCKPLETLLKEEVLPERGDQLLMVKVDVHECPDLAEKYKILSVPTVILLSPDESVLWRRSGSFRKEEIEAVLG